MFRDLIPALADNYHVVAPDLSGFGFSDAPDRKNYRYTFEQIAKTIAAFTQTIGLNRFAMYVFDYGAPVGFRLALAHPERIAAIVSQNGNAYEEGLQRGLESDPEILEGADGAESPGLAGVSHTRGHEVSIRVWRTGRDR